MSEPWFLGMEPEVLVLSAADSLAFAEALLDPPEPTEYLIAAMRRHRELVESGELSVDETTCAGLSYPAKTPEV